MKLFPLLAQMYAQALASHHVSEMYRQLMKDIENDKFELLDILHHYTSGMKAVYTSETFAASIHIR